MTSKVAVIGVGRMGRYHCRVLSRLGRLCAIADVKPSPELQKEYSVPIYTDYKQMMEKHPEIEGIVVSTPTSNHAELTEELLEYSNIKAILVEKPVAASIEAGNKLKEKASGSNKKISVGHIEVYNPVVRRMIQIVEEKTIGEIRTVVFERRGAVSDGRLESIGDILQDIAIHDFDTASRLLPEDTYTLVAKGLMHQGVINTATVVMASPKTTCTFLFSREYAGKVRKVEIEGSKATMLVDLLDQFIEIRELAIATGDTKSITVPFGSGTRIKTYGEPLLEEIWNFLDTIEGSDPLVNLDDGIAGMKLVELSRKSIEDGESKIYKLKR